MNAKGRHEKVKEIAALQGKGIRNKKFENCPRKIKTKESNSTYANESQTKEIEATKRELMNRMEKRRAACNDIQSGKTKMESQKTRWRMVAWTLEV